MNFKRWGRVLLPVVMLGMVFWCAQSGISFAAEPDIPEGFGLVAENQNLKFYMHEKNSQILVYDRRNGYLWRSAPDTAGKDLRVSELWKQHLESVFVLNFSDSKKRHIKATNNINENARLDFQRIDDGIRVTYELQKLNMDVTVEYRLGDDYLEVIVPEGGIVEHGDKIAVSIELLPFFGAADDYQDGYLLVPDGSGALTYFKEEHPRYTKVFSEFVFGEDTYDFQPLLERETQHKTEVVMPVFGLKKNNAAYLGIITKGQFNAKITSAPSGYILDYNRGSATFIVRRQYSAPIAGWSWVNTLEDKMVEHDRAVRYYLLCGDKANYVGMAEAYRRYLLEQGVEKLTRVGESVPLQLRIFHGVSRKVMVWHEFVTMTTFDESIEMLDALEEAGVDDMDITCVGWNYLGYDGAYPRRLPAAAPVGGTEGLKDFASFARSKGYRVFVEDNYLEAFDTAGGFSSRRDVVRGPNKLPLSGWGKYLLNPVFAWNKYVSRDMKRMGEYHVNGVELRDLGKIVLSDNNFRNPLSREQWAQEWLRFAEYSRDVMGYAVSNGANVYVLGHVDMVSDIPMERSVFDFVDDTIPFYEIVIHGLVPYTAYPGNLRSDPRREYLMMIEYGAVPAFELTWREPREIKNTKYNRLFSSYYPVWEETVAQEYQEVCKELGYLQAEYITGHAEVAPRVKWVTYGDGSQIYINYNPEPVAVDGVSIDGLDYVLIKGGEAE